MSRQLLFLSCLYFLLLLLGTHSSCASSTGPIAFAQGVVSTDGNYTTAPRAISACSCSDCRCSLWTAETCPASIPASATYFRSSLCVNGQRPLVKSVRADSTDGSKFRVYGLNADNYSKYRAGQSFNYIPEISTVQDVTCTEKNPSVVLLDSSYAYFGFKCNNLLSNCPIRFEVEIDCVVGPATTIELYVSTWNLYNDETFYATATLRDSTGAIDTYATEMVYLRVNDGPGSLLGQVGANPNGGVARFENLRFTAPGTYKLVAQYESLTTLSRQIEFFKPEVTSIEVTTDLDYSDIIANKSLVNVIVNHRDRDGTLISKMPEGMVQVAKYSGPGRLLGNTTIYVHNDYGSVTFKGLKFDEPGSYVLAGSFGSVSGTSEPIKVVRLASLKIILSPYRPSVGQPFSLTVWLYDEEEVPVVYPGCGIQVTKFSGPGMLFGNTTSSETRVHGLWVNEAGTYKLSVTCGSATGSHEFLVEDPNASSSVRQSPSHWLLLVVVLSLLVWW